MDTTPFSQQIATLAKGTLDAELTEELTALVRAINDHGKKGSITVKLSLKPTVHHGEVIRVEIMPDVTVSSPQPQRLSSSMWPTHDGDLLRDDPDQQTLDLKQIDTTTGEAKEL